MREIEMPPKVDLKQVGLRIAKLRRMRNMSREKLAEAIGIEATQVSKLEHGYANSKLTTVYALCRVLEVSLSELVGTPEPAEDTALLTAQSLLNGFTPGELGVIADLLQTAQRSLTKNV